MLNCKKAAALMSQGQDRKLGFSERMSLKFHLMMCSGCRNFSKQVEFLRRGCREFSTRDG